MASDKMIISLTSLVEYSILCYLLFTCKKKKENNNKKFMYFSFRFKRDNAYKVTTAPDVRKHQKMIAVKTICIIFLIRIWLIYN